MVIHKLKQRNPTATEFLSETLNRSLPQKNRQQMNDTDTPATSSRRLKFATPAWTLRTGPQCTQHLCKLKQVWHNMSPMNWHTGCFFEFGAHMLHQDLRPEVPATEAGNLKIAKVARRGCKGVLASWRHGLPRVSLRQCIPLLHQCNRLLVNIQPKHPLCPLLTTLGNFKVSGLCSRHFASQIKIWCWIRESGTEFPIHATDTLMLVGGKCCLP